MTYNYEGKYFEENSGAELATSKTIQDTFLRWLDTGLKTGTVGKVWKLLDGGHWETRYSLVKKLGEGYSYQAVGKALDWLMSLYLVESEHNPEDMPSNRKDGFKPYRIAYRRKQDGTMED